MTLPTKTLFGERDYSGDVLKNNTFTVFADLATATAVAGSIFGFAFIADVGALFYNQAGAWVAIGAKGTKGDTGIQGIQGIPGVDGNTLLSGAGVPGVGLGVNGNFYIDTTAVAIYGPKTGGAWGSATQMVGAAGTNGNTILNGVVVPTIEGVDGDFYLNTLTMDLYGPKAGGLWPVTATTLIGPQGLVGPVGPQGIPGVSPGGGAYFKAYVGNPSLLTTESHFAPVAPPTPPVIYHFNSATGLYWEWDGANWIVQPFGSYLDINTGALYEMGVWSTNNITGWVVVQANIFVHPTVSASGSITRLGPVIFVPFDSTSGPLSLTLPSAIDGDVVILKDVSGTAALNPATVTAPGVVTLDGVAGGSITIDTAFGSSRLQCSGLYVTVLPIAPSLWANGSTVPALSYRANAGNLYHTVAGGITTTPNAPVHLSGTVTGTDGVDWTFVSPPAAPGWVRVSEYYGNPHISSIGVSSPLDRRLDQVAKVDSTAAAFTLTLPASPVEEDVVHVKDVSGLCEANPVTLATAATFEGATPVLDASFMEITLVYRGAKWVVVSQYRNAVTTATSLNSAGPLADKRDQTILYDVSGAGFALVLPPTPREGDKVRFKEKTGSTNILTLTGTVDGVLNPTYNTAYLAFTVEYLSGAWYRMQ